MTNYPYRDFTHAVEELDRLTDAESKKWFEEKRKVGIIWALRSMVSAFWKVYFGQKECRNGVRGLFFAVHQGMFVFLSYAKYWELGRNQKSA